MQVLPNYSNNDKRNSRVLSFGDFHRRETLSWVPTTLRVLHPEYLYIITALPGRADRRAVFAVRDGR